ncbi:MAG: SagB/ThcOx family dehydrogenase [candidate division Zixibacteria bacterium]|nr:SagB/ThcOx family dehydrogenase [candidate division Zixibacteria bacterium]
MNEAGQQFLEESKYDQMGQSDQMKGMPPPPMELPYDTTGAVIDLPSPREFRPTDDNLKAVIEKRRTLRPPAREPLTMAELSYLLWCTQGVQKVLPPPDARTVRNVPSAGGKHTFETYLLVNRVEGLKPGVYRFLAIDHKLVEVDTSEGLSGKMVKGCLDQQHVGTSAVMFIWVAVAQRTIWRYNTRGYRYMFLDAGHVCQNLYLSAESIGCGACAIGAYSDNEVNRLLDLDGREQFVIYMGTVGRKR